MKQSPAHRAASIGGQTTPLAGAMLAALLGRAATTQTAGQEPTKRQPRRTFTRKPRKPGTGDYQAPLASDKPLSSKQRQVLGRLAGRAYRRHADLDLVDGLSETDWRHREVHGLIRVAGLREATNRDFVKLEAHFAALAGEDIRAFKAEMKLNRGNFRHNAGEDHEQLPQALWLLDEALAERGLGQPYALAMATQRFGVKSLDRLSAAEAMILVFEIRRLFRPLRKGETTPVRRDTWKVIKPVSLGTDPTGSYQTPPGPVNTP